VTIYCVVPEVLQADLYDKLVEHYKDDPGVEVIVDRRGGPDRRDKGAPPPEDTKREVRDRRRRRPAGTFPSVEAPE